VPASRHPFAPGTWQTGTKLPARRAETTAISLDGRIYIPGGLDQAGTGPGGGARSLSSVLVYDPATDAYANAADMPDGRDHIGIATWAGKIYVSGGGFFSVPAVRDNLWVYDPAADAWAELPPMPVARWQHAMVAVDGVLYVVGGVIRDTRDWAPVWAYDIDAGTWRTDLAPLPTPREHLSAIVADGKIYVLGGRLIGNLPTVEIYDPQAGVWTSGPDMPTARGGMTIGLLEGVIHVTGGENLDQNSTYPQHEGLDLATMTWQTYAEIPNKRHGLMSGVAGGSWYVMGGGRAAGLSTSDLVDIWTP
jgi:N-acetylneuraminic acid mutarotase